MNTSFRSPWPIVVASLLWAAAALGEWKAGMPLPNLAAYGPAAAPAQLAGKVVLVDFWASWCAPCKVSFPILDGLQKKFGARGFTVLAVNVDEDPADMEAFLAEHPASFPVIGDARQKLVEAAAVEAMPSSYLVDRAGTIRFVHAGFEIESTPEELNAEIESLLGPEARP